VQGITHVPAGFGCNGDYMDASVKVLSDPVNKLDDSNTNLTNAMLGSPPDRAELIQWARGVDVDDEDADGGVGVELTSGRVTQLACRTALFRLAAVRNVLCRIRPDTRAGIREEACIGIDCGVVILVQDRELAVVETYLVALEIARPTNVRIRTKTAKYSSSRWKSLLKAFTDTAGAVKVSLIERISVTIWVKALDNSWAVLAVKYRPPPLVAAALSNGKLTVKPMV
jgi:hypothetical protein